MNKTINKEIANLLVEMRKSRGLSQQGLADRLGIARTTYANYEQGTREVSMETLIKVCDICSHDIHDVVEYLKDYAFK